MDLFALENKNRGFSRINLKNLIVNHDIFSFFYQTET